MLRRLAAGIAPPPAFGPRLWLTLATGVVGGLNLVFYSEIWPHTPAARPLLSALLWLVVLALPPQLLWWVWRWLRAYTGPGWLRLLATAVFLSGACLVLAGWLAVLAGGPFWLYWLGMGGW
jgi:hypothetical protein